MSNIVKLDVVETEMMEMRFSGVELNVSYEQVGIQANSYGCTGCGLVWDRKWYAEQCEDRSHVSKWEQKYGGITENNVRKNYKAYQRNARGYRKDIVNV